MEQLKEEKMMAEKSKFEEELEKLNINLTEHQKEQFDRYYEMLVEWNNVMNLTGITASILFISIFLTSVRLSVKCFRFTSS